MRRTRLSSTAPSHAALGRKLRVLGVTGLVVSGSPLFGCGADVDAQLASDDGSGLPDTTPPSVIDDLRVKAVSADSVTLEWTAPGDDGAEGRAAQYDLRFADTAKQIDDWEGARSFQAPAPAAAGTAQSVVVTGLRAGVTYYFRIAAGDEVPNWAAPSNRAQGTTSSDGADPDAPSGLTIAPPVGPFVTVDGAFQTSTGVYYGAYELAQGKREIKKYIVRNHTDINVGAMNWKDGAAHPISSPVLIEDIIAEGASRTPPRSADGTSEANMWVGTTAIARRFVLRNGAWMGLWTGGLGGPGMGCQNSLFEDFEVLDQPHIGIYIEHETANTTFRRFRVRSQGTGINVEWWYREDNGEMGGSHGLIIEDFDIRSEEDWGIFIDAGNYDITIRNGKLSGHAGIAHPKNLVDPTKPIKIDWATIDTSELEGPREMVHDNAIGW